VPAVRFLGKNKAEGGTVSRTQLIHSPNETLSPRPGGLPEEPAPTRRILIAEDNELSGRQLQQLLTAELRLQVDVVRNGQEALATLTKQSYSILITDLKMPRLDGIELIEEVQKRRLPVTVIVTTGHGSIDEAVQAMRLGAYDFITKPIDVQHLRLVIQRALRERTLQDEVVALRDQLQSRYSYQNVISKSPRMHAIFELINNLSQTTTTVLIEGETGTGKEMIARAIHHASQLRHGPLITVNCAALPESLLESELFGHEKGAFTSAVRQRRGRFELAEGGTLFLDEVGDIPAAMQAKLLRVLQERRFERVGGTETIEMNARVMAATNRSLQQLVKDGTFREDLYYRLNVVKIDLPPLRDRPEDIPLLAAHFAAKYARPGEPPKEIAADMEEALLSYRWPGNVRELENVMERACVTSTDAVLQLANLPPELTAPSAAPQAYTIDLERPLGDLLREACARVEREYLRQALEKSQGNIGRCAEICGLSRRSISDKLAEYHLDKAAFKKP
jgi:DNA-binding NtrC family response regulator